LKHNRVLNSKILNLFINKSLLIKMSVLRVPVLFKKNIFFLCFFSTILLSGYAQSFTHAERANYIIDIADDVIWKDIRKIDVFKVAILETDSALYNVFVDIAAKRQIHEKPISIRMYDHVNDIENVQVVFVNRNSGFDIDRVYQHIKGQGILLISENYPFHKSMINFIVVDNKKRFEMNQNRMDEEGFRTKITFASLAVKNELDWHSIYKETERELYEQKELVEQQKVLIAQQKEVLDNMIQEVELQKNRLISYIHEIELLEEEIGAQSHELKALQNMISIREALIKEKEAVLDIVNKEVKKKEAENKRQQEILDAQIASIELQEQLITEQGETLSEQLEKLHLQTLIINLGLALLILFMVLVYFIYRSYRIKKQSNIKLEEKNKEILKQKELIQIEKDKSDKLLLNILPLKVAEDLKMKGYTDPEEFKDVSVFFSDFVGFTEKSSKLEPRILIQELNDLYTAFDNIMQLNKCERIKTIGDAYLAVCGMPIIDADNAKNIIEAARQIVAYIEKRNETSEIKWLIRIGIHTGKVVGGIVGVKKFIYDIFGDTINVAARMESNSEPMRINISESTYTLLKEHYSFEPRGHIFVKGKGNQNMYFLNN